jgi:transketolase
VDGHDDRTIYRAVRAALGAARPTLVACHTVMSKGIPFMEKEGYKWHGAALPVAKCREALAILGLPDDLDHWIAERKKPAPDWHAVLPRRPKESVVLPAAGTPRSYAADASTDNRTAFGQALQEVGDAAAAAKSDGGPRLRSLKSTKTASSPRAPEFFQGIAGTMPPS